ncbi:hypothetical protein CDD81_2398 [Ophiocordyceps australis]|uniref:Uncharacterized protein n=1 Tax=Ophiocordyceps australis TaxID=1399860 RepID=A0A2C5XXS5_9HYPO|nr:hypothetical protein CDD81_2398 [Ophiocordyceps australis]
MELSRNDLPILKRIFDRSLKYIDSVYANCNSRGINYSNTEHYPEFEELEAQDPGNSLDDVNPSLNKNAVESGEDWGYQTRPKRHSDGNSNAQWANTEYKDEIAQESKRTEYVPKDGSSYSSEDTWLYKESYGSGVTSQDDVGFSNHPRKHAASTSSSQWNTQSLPDAEDDDKVSGEASEARENSQSFTFEPQEDDIKTSEKMVEAQNGLRESTVALKDHVKFQSIKTELGSKVAANPSYQPQDLAAALGGAVKRPFKDSSNIQPQSENSASGTTNASKSQSPGLIPSKETISNIQSQDSIQDEDTSQASNGRDQSQPENTIKKANSSEDDEFYPPRSHGLNAHSPSAPPATYYNRVNNYYSHMAPTDKVNSVRNKNNQSPSSASKLDLKKTNERPNKGSFIDNGSGNESTNNQDSNRGNHVGSNGGDFLDKGATDEFHSESHGTDSEGHSDSDSSGQQTITESGAGHGQIGGDSTEGVTHNSHESDMGQSAVGNH